MFKPGDKKPEGSGRKPGQTNKATAEMVQFCREFLTSPEYQAKLKDRILRGKAERVEQLMHHYAFGKPVETVAITGADGGAIQIQAVEAEQAAGAAKSRVLKLVRGGLHGNGAGGNGAGAGHAAG